MKKIFSLDLGPWRPMESYDARSAFEHCRRVVRDSGTSFYYAMALLPEEQRREMFAFYAFCRRADDVADDVPDPAIREALFRELEASLDAIYQQKAAGCPEMAALGRVVWKRRIPRTYLDAILDGCRRDGAQRLYPSYEALEGYCHRVSTAVGLATCHIAGLRGEAMLDYALPGGVAVQLTNILRDVDEDRRLGRVYLPEDWLVQEGVSPGDVLAGRSSPGLARVVRRLALAAESLYEQAQRALRPAHRRALLVLELAQVLYRPLLARLAERDYEVFGERIRLRGREKLLGVLRYGVARRGLISSRKTTMAVR